MRKRFCSVVQDLTNYHWFRSRNCKLIGRKRSPGNFSLGASCWSHTFSSKVHIRYTYTFNLRSSHAARTSHPSISSFFNQCKINQLSTTTNNSANQIRAGAALTSTPTTSILIMRLVFRSKRQLLLALRTLLRHDPPQILFLELHKILTRPPDRC